MTTSDIECPDICGTGNVITVHPVRPTPGNPSVPQMLVTGKSVTVPVYAPPAANAPQKAADDFNLDPEMPFEWLVREARASGVAVYPMLQPYTRDEQTGSQSFVPPDPKDDKALKTALDLIRGVTTNSAFPPNAKRAAN